MRNRHNTILYKAKIRHNDHLSNLFNFFWHIFYPMRVRNSLNEYSNNIK
nr:MAG TPA: hypothetical protein [Caudoviricetes sp.]